MLVSVSSDDQGEYIDISPTATWQLEALPPDELARIVRQAIEDRLDRKAYDDMLAEEVEVREEVLSRLARNGDDEPDSSGGLPQPPPHHSRRSRGRRSSLSSNALLSRSRGPLSILWRVARALKVRRHSLFKKALSQSDCCLQICRTFVDCR
jgi:hypothetical protein